MDKDEIIRTALGAGAIQVDGKTAFYTDDLERFAAIVAEPWIKTNKALANEIIELKKQVDISALPIIIEAAVKEAVLVERDGCAVAAEQVVPRHTECGNKIAAAIRARSNNG